MLYNPACSDVHIPGLMAVDGKTLDGFRLWTTGIHLNISPRLSQPPPLPQTAIHCFISSVQIGWFIIWAWCVHDMTPPKIPSWSRISTNWSIFWQDTSFSCGHRSSCSRRAACFLRSLQWYGIQCSVSDISHVFVFCRMYPPACLRPLISAARVA